MGTGRFRKRVFTQGPLTVAVDERGGDLAVVTPAGELDMATAPRLDQALRRAEQRYDVLVLDLGRLTFIDSSGIRTIFRTAQRAREGLFAFSIKPGPPAVMHTLDVLGLTAQLPIHG
jgi:anti-anti-sigma factor